ACSRQPPASFHGLSPANLQCKSAALSSFATGFCIPPLPCGNVDGSCGALYPACERVCTGQCCVASSYVARLNSGGASAIAFTCSAVNAARKIFSPAILPPKWPSATLVNGGGAISRTA